MSASRHIGRSRYIQPGSHPTPCLFASVWPADHVTELIDYAGTTAAGLVAMQDTDLDKCIAKGLDAANEKARRIG